MFRKHLFFSLLLLSVLLVISCPREAASNSSPALDAFFLELDKNHDGAIDVSEATKFIGGSIGGQEFDEPQEAAEAAASFLHTIDGGDAGATVSVDELDIHLHAVLSGVRVWEWIRHGVGLPQYSDAFRQHAITALDFPVLVQENGRVLEEELGIASPFHRSKVVRAIRRQILGLGTPPSEPLSVACSPVPNGAPGRVAVHWRPPAETGTPPLHKYVLEVAAPDGQWRLVTEVDDPEPAAVVVDLGTAEPAGPGARAAVTGGVRNRLGAPRGGHVMAYRVSAWNLYGRSPYGMGSCVLETAEVAAEVAGDDSVPPPGYPAPGTLATVNASKRGSSTHPGQGMLPRQCGLEGAEICEPELLRPRQAPNAQHEHDAHKLHLWLQQEQEQSPGTLLAHHTSGSRPGPRPHQAEAEGRPASFLRWWGSVLLAVLPWLLRLLPLHVLGAIAEGAQGLLARATHAVRVLTPRQWNHQVTHGSDSELDPVPGGAASGAAAPSLSSGTAGAAGAGQTAGAPPGAMPGVPPHNMSLSSGLPVAAPPSGILPYSGLDDRSRHGPPRLPVTPDTSVAGGSIFYGSGGNGGGDDGRSSNRLGPPTAALSNGGAAGSTLPPGLLPPGSTLPPGLLRAALATKPPQAPPQPGPALVGDVSVRAGAANGGVQDNSGAGYGGAGGGDKGSRSAPHRSGSEGDIYLLSAPGPAGMAWGAGSGPRPDSPSGYPPPQPIPRPLQTQTQPPSQAILQHHHHMLRNHHLVGSAPSLGILSATAAAGGSLPSVPGSPSLPGHHHHHHPNHPYSQHFHARPTGGSVHGGHSASGGVSSGDGGVGGGGGSGNGGGGGDNGWLYPYSEEELAEAEALAAGIAAGKVCAAPGCRRKLDLLHVRDYLRRHYCGRCQKYVCQAHTAFSPHGDKGSCDHVSACVCTSCFAEFSPERQRALQKLNKLPQPAATVSVPGTSAGSAAGLAAGSVALQDGVTGGAAGVGGKSAAKKMWERAAVKLKAVTRFKGKRGPRRVSSSSGNVVAEGKLEPVVE